MPTHPDVVRRHAWRTALASGLVLTMALCSPMQAQASWTTSESTLTASVMAGKLTIAQTGFEALAKTYSSTELATTAPLTVSNAGTVPAPFSLTFGLSVTSALGSAAQVSVWPVTRASECTASVNPTGVAAKTWATVGTFTGTLAPTADAVYCVRSRISQAQRFANVGTSYTATATVVAVQGSWSSTASASAIQQDADTLTPGPVTGTSKTDRSISFSWAAPVDTAVVTGYSIYRDGKLVITVPATQRTYTDTGRSVLTSYSYTVVAIDSAIPVDVSPASAPVGLSTGTLLGSGWYQLRNTGTGLCVDAEGEGYSSGTALISYSCHGGDNQLWKFTANGPTYTIAADGGFSMYVNTTSAQKVELQRFYSRYPQWTLTQIPGANGTFTVRTATGLCLDVTGTQTPDRNRQLVTKTCDGSLNQSFSLTFGG